MRILIIGGSGFQGSHIAEACLKAGHRVSVLNTLSETAERNMAPFVKDVPVVWGSVTDSEIVRKSVRGHDLVIHLAARINVDESIHVPYEFLMSNVVGTHNVLEAVRTHSSRLIYASSCEVYGNAITAARVTETAELRPHSPYAASKAAADRMCFAYWMTYGINVTIVRACNIYGPRQRGGKGGAVIPIFLERALARQPLVVNGTGEQRREYMYIDDLVAAYMCILGRDDLQGEVLNVGTGESPSIKEIAAVISEKLGTRIEHEPMRCGQVMGFSLDSGKARKLGFTPQVTFWDGLERYIGWKQGTQVS